jgi:hypothetical protein
MRERYSRLVLIPFPPGVVTHINLYRDGVFMIDFGRSVTITRVYVSCPLNASHELYALCRSSYTTSKASYSPSRRSLISSLEPILTTVIAENFIK